jgi:hypothetical protein
MVDSLNNHGSFIQATMVTDWLFYSAKGICYAKGCAG